jgi:cell division control protein 45
MVLTDRGEMVQIFADVKAAAAESADTPTVLLLASHSIDSLAACTMLGRLLEDELVSHKVVSVTDYAELARVYREQVVEATELRSVFLLNCGGIVDLMSHLQQALDEADGDAPSGRQARDLPHPDCRWYILDSHRPYALENVYHDPHEVRVDHRQRCGAHVRWLSARPTCRILTVGAGIRAGGPA